MDRRKGRAEIGDNGSGRWVDWLWEGLDSAAAMAEF